MIRLMPFHRLPVIVITLAASLGSAAPARGQDVKVDVRVQIPPDLVRDLERVVEQSAQIAMLAVDEALRGALRDAEPWLAFPGIAGEREQDRSRGRDLRVERQDRTTRTIAIGPQGLLELRSLSGEITVTAGSGGEVALEIVRRSRGRTEADAALGLQQVQVNVDHRGERAAVEAVYPRGRQPYQVSTTYNVTAPAGTRITIRSISGNASVQGITGDVSAELVSGNLTVTGAGRVSHARSVSGDVRLADIETDGTIAAGTVSGTIVLERVRARRLTVENVSGNVRATDVACDSAQLKSLSGNVDYAGPLTRGGRYELESHSGTVRLVAEGGVGFELQARTFSGRVRPENVSLQSSGMSRGQMRATVGDGSALVVAQTFSGDVVVARK